jgi:hypothetical protein
VTFWHPPPLSRGMLQKRLGGTLLTQYLCGYGLLCRYWYFNAPVVAEQQAAVVGEPLVVWVPWRMGRRAPPGSRTARPDPTVRSDLHNMDKYMLDILIWHVLGTELEYRR